MSSDILDDKVVLAQQNANTMWKYLKCGSRRLKETSTVGSPGIHGTCSQCCVSLPSTHTHGFMMGGGGVVS